MTKFYRHPQNALKGGYLWALVTEQGEVVSYHKTIRGAFRGRHSIGLTILETSMLIDPEPEIFDERSEIKTRQFHGIVIANERDENL